MNSFPTATAAAFFDIWVLLEQHEVVEVFIIDAMLLTVTCSWFCTRLLEFSLMSLCKNSFSSSKNAPLPSLILKENRRNIQKQTLGYVLWKRCSFVPRLHDVDIGWAEKDYSHRRLFISHIILPETRTSSFSNESAILVQ